MPALAAFAAPASAAEVQDGGVGKVKGKAWHDVNGNGLRDRGEPGVAGVWVGYQQLIDGEWGLYYQKALTGADGTYVIKGIPAGEYRIIAGSSDYLFTKPAAGNPKRDSDFTDYIGNPDPGVQQWASSQNIQITDGSRTVLDAGFVSRPAAQ